jgi:hypothetical protein
VQYLADEQIELLNNDANKWIDEFKRKDRKVSVVVTLFFWQFYSIPVSLKKNTRRNEMNSE